MQNHLSSSVRESNIPGASMAIGLENSPNPKEKTDLAFVPDSSWLSKPAGFFDFAT